MDRPAEIVEVTTPSRLHFGMFSFGREDARRFGGVGMMVDQPSLRLRFSPEERLHARGPLAERTIEFVHRWTAKTQPQHFPHCHIDILAVPQQHAGLGVSTQLGLAVAVGLNAMVGRQQASVSELASLVGRGLRSSVGIYGFQHGGLIVEKGKLPGEAISPLAARSELPDDWRVVLVQSTARRGLFGKAEQQAFESLSPIPEKVSVALWKLVETEMLPALMNRDFEAFSESIYHYGYQAGMAFSAVQGGPYNGPQLAEIVATARRLRAAGVGQSSWGPTIFCLVRNEHAAAEFVERMRRELTQINATYTIARPNNRGAEIRIASDAARPE